MIRAATAEARSLLQPVYDHFSEGFDTLDLKEAKAFLAHSGDLERSIRSIMNTDSGDHEHLLALA